MTTSDNPPTALAALISEAQSWLGTPYEHMGRTRGVGCDCATFIADVFANAGVIPRLEIPQYDPFWHLHRNAEKYLEAVTRHAQAIDPRVSPPRPGDVVVWRYGRTYSHGAIVVDWPTIIEAHTIRGVILNTAMEHSGRPFLLYRHPTLA